MAVDLEDQLPSFPENVVTVPIARISHEELLLNNERELTRVLTACQTDGFFYLDLRTSEAGQRLLNESEKILSLAKELFNVPLDTKMSYKADRGKSLFGYKPAGTVKKTDKDQRPDTTEFFNIGKDHLYGFVECRTYPDKILESKPMLRDFVKDCHSCGQLVLGVLAQQLGIARTQFTNKNKFELPSGDHIRVTKKTPHNARETHAIGLPSHTDFGSITVLFNWLGGLQIQSHEPEKQGEWAYVKPLPGHAIINLGDAMVKFSNGKLKSAKHRVIPAPGVQGSVDRYSVVYFVRPADEMLMQPVEEFRDQETVKVGGKVGEEKMYTAGEWMTRRINQLSSSSVPGGN